MTPCWLWVGGRMIYNVNTYISLLWTDGHASTIASMLVEVALHPTSTSLDPEALEAQFIMHTPCSRTWSFTLSLHVTVFGRGSRGLGSGDFTTPPSSSTPAWLSSFVPGPSPPIISVKVEGKVTAKRAGAQSWLSVHTRPCPIFLHLSPSLTLGGRGSHIVWMPSACEQWNNLPALSSPGQNESGVAVHDDRIYVVGGYSIWTNEPLACIQVRDAAFTFGPRNSRGTSEWSDKVIGIQLFYW